MWNNLYKVSGTASRYDSKRAYHHFTLLLDVDKTHLNTLLQPCLSGIVGNPATASIPASTVNLKEIEDELTFDNVVECVGDYFISKGLPIQRAGIQYAEPTEDKRYPGLHTIVSELRDWTWVYGKTPAFFLYRVWRRSRHVNDEYLDKIIELHQSQVQQQHFKAVNDVLVLPNHSVPSYY
ncbi:LIPT1 [Acanthosepion pharaonis]|uniref:LIPT1 n=1 Tax=Acanthosepion pharaonis TaxID=158019 RepID=A0A812ES38_ACAPH|nr:LIPT1 [Sepia pharaonis]